MTEPLASNWRQPESSLAEQTSAESDLQSKYPIVDVPPPSTQATHVFTSSSHPDVTTTTSPLESAPTDSHALATEEHEVKGAAQIEHDEVEVKDLGWDEDPKHIPAPVVGGLPNEDLWILVRRFNKVILSK
jgi:Protein of unknown function (DUF3292)